MSSDGIVMDIDEDYLEETNEIVLTRELERTGREVFIETNPKKIPLVFPKISEYGNTGNIKEDLILKATAILATIPWLQVFFDGNRRTAIMAAGTFLLDNGYLLDIDPEGENKELRGMLEEIKRHFRDIDITIFNRLMLYVKERISNYEPNT